MNVLVKRFGGLGDLLMLRRPLAGYKLTHPTNTIYLHSSLYAPFLMQGVPIEFCDEKSSISFDKVFNLHNRVEFNMLSTLIPRELFFAWELGTFVDSSLSSRLTIPSESQVWSGAVVSVLPRPIIGLQGKSAALCRVWPESHINTFIQLVSSSIGSVIFFTGMEEPGSSVYGELRIGMLSIQNLAALVSECDVFVCPDSGLMHLRQYVCDRPTVALFGSIDPDFRTRGYVNCTVVFDRSLPCVPCHDWVTSTWCQGRSDVPTCMFNYSPEHILEVVRNVL